MKLKHTFVTHEIDGEQVMVSPSASSFSGMVKNNETAAFIVNCLKQDTTKEIILEAMSKEYDAPLEVMSKDIDQILMKLKKIGALDE